MSVAHATSNAESIDRHLSFAQQLRRDIATSLDRNDDDTLMVALQFAQGALMATGNDVYRELAEYAAHCRQTLRARRPKTPESASDCELIAECEALLADRSPRPDGPEGDWIELDEAVRCDARLVTSGHFTVIASQPHGPHKTSLRNAVVLQFDNASAVDNYTAALEMMATPPRSA